MKIFGPMKKCMHLKQKEEQQQKKFISTIIHMYTLCCFKMSTNLLEDTQIYI